MTLIHNSNSHQEGLLIPAARASSVEAPVVAGVKKGKLNWVTVELTENELPQFIRLTHLFQKSILQHNVNFIVQITPSLPKNIGREDPSPSLVEIQRISENALQT